MQTGLKEVMDILWLEKQFGGELKMLEENCGTLKRCDKLVQSLGKEHSDKYCGEFLDICQDTDKS